MIHSDLSILQRLSIGFGLLLLLSAGLVAMVFVLQSRSVAAQAEFEERLAPRGAVAHDVERAVMAVGLAARGYLLASTADALGRYTESVRLLRDHLQRLAAMPMDMDDRASLAALTPPLEVYLLTVDRNVRQAQIARVSNDGEVAMSAARETAVAAVREFVDLQNAKEQGALTTMGLVRTNVRRGLVFMTALTAIGFVAIAFVTAQSVQRPARDLLQVAGALQAGDWQPALAWAPPRADGGPDRRGRPRSEMTRLAHAFGAAAAALERREQRLKADAAVATATSTNLQRDEVAGATLRAIVAHAQAAVGAVYWHDAVRGMLEPVAHHALAAAPRAVRVGDGVPGEAAEQRRTILVRDIPPDTPWTISLGYDAAPPRTVVAVPILFRSDLLGVMVLASLRDLDVETLAFLEAVSVQFGIGLQNVRAHEEIERLVAELREQNQTIQAQNEEIQAQNEEIQAQSEELQAQNEELQAQNEEIQAQNDQIRERADQVERQGLLLAEADGRKNEFLATLGHELRNPMAALTVSLQVFNQSDPASERAARARAVIERQVQHLIRLIDDLLDLTRISRGKISIERVPLDLAEVVRACVDDQRVAMDAKGITLDVDVPDAPVWVDGDRTRLCQIVNNLLHNSYKFSDDRGRISLHLVVMDSEAVLRIADDGAGIDSALLPHIFEPFWQGAATLARTNTGLGLGLALVRTFTELHDGTVEACSSGAGRGSQFVVRLPLGSSAASPSRVHPVDAQGVRSWRILVVEDNADAAWSLGQMLLIEGHRVEVAHSGSDALQKADAFEPELVLCDIGLPEMDGYQLARRFRTDDRLKAVPLVALTGYATPADQAQAFAAGFTHHMAKPLDAAHLRRLLNQLDATKRLIGTVG